MKTYVIHKDTGEVVRTFETLGQACYHVSKTLSWATHYVKKAPKPCCVEGCNKQGYERKTPSGVKVGAWCSMHYRAKTYPHERI